MSLGERINTASIPGLKILLKVEGLSDEPVGLATLGSGQACRSSGSVIAAEPSSAFKAGDFRKHNCREGEGQPKN
jgi:hypothetical protein